MRWWPFSRNEKRQSASYSDAILNELVRAAGGEVALATATAATEAAAGLWARALAGARSSHPAVTPAYMACIGREIVRRGEALHAIEVDDVGLVRLVPIAHWDVWGGADPRGWWYNCTLNGPSTSTVRPLPRDAVVHQVYATDPGAPWRGVSPLRYAGATGTLLANLESKLGQEVSGPVGSVLPLPRDGGVDDDDDDPMAPLKAAIKTLRGRMAFVESMAFWNQAQSGSQQVPARMDWAQKRIGADPPATLRDLRGDVAASILDACGVPVSLVTDADGTSQRESWRRFVMGAVQPQAKSLAAELNEKLEVEVTFDFSALWAHDAVSRSQVLHRLTMSGVDLPLAREMAGL